MDNRMISFTFGSHWQSGQMPVTRRKQTGFVLVTDLKCDGLPSIGFPKHAGIFYLGISINLLTKKTPPAKRSQAPDPSWDEQLYFDMDRLNTDLALLEVKVYAKRIFGHTIVCELENPIDISALKDGNHIIKETLCRPNKRGSKNHPTTIQFTLRRKREDLPLNLVDNVSGEIKLDEPHIKLLERVFKGTNIAIENIDINDSYIMWSPLLESMSAVVNIVNDIAEIHPYARIVWKTLSLPINVMVAQNRRDQAMLLLFATMKDTYDLITEYGDKVKLDQANRRQTVMQILQQSMECAIFIRDYASRGYVGRTSESMVSDISGHIKMYFDKFQSLKRDFIDQGNLVTEITAAQISTVVDEIRSLLQDADALRLVDDMYTVKHQIQPDACLPGTRQGIISEIVGWSFRPEDEDSEHRLYWLSGVAGCGKSAIARSVSDQLEAHRRCASFYFHLAPHGGEGPERLFATLSRKLADIDDGWKACLSKILKDNMQMRTTTLVKWQFEHFLLEPAVKVDGIGPILIIIDGLDESNRDSRRELMDMLKRIPEFPPRFRFFITSRPAQDIEVALGDQPWVYRKDLHTLDASSTDKDIKIYIKHVLHLNNQDFEDRLVARAGQIFQWANTACKFVQDDTVVLTQSEKLEHILASPYGGLDGLYQVILQQQCKLQGEISAVRRFQIIVGRILLLQEPLSLNELSELWCNAKEDKGKDRVRSLLSPLGSLLVGVTARDATNNTPIRPTHISFVEFLRDKKRSGDYYVDIEDVNTTLTTALFRVMDQSLRLNICDLKTSLTPNSDVRDLEKRIKENIRPHLDYACRYFVYHLSRIPASTEWINHVDKFMRSKLLFWFEALSLSKKISVGLNQLSILQDWLESQDDIDDLKLFVRDAYRFGANFGRTAEDCTPHLYLSALSYIPRDSPLAQVYLPKFPGRIGIHNDHKFKWPDTDLSIKVSSEITAVAFSPDGKQVVSGSTDGIVRLWDASTGETMVMPFIGHVHSVTSVGFSPDGKRVVSGSSDRTVRIWDLYSGNVAEPFEGHTDSVMSVRFSPDGARVVSSSSDWTIRVWDASTGGTVVGPLNGHTGPVTSVHFSPDCGQIISGSVDCTIRVWDARTGQSLTNPFRGHTDSVTSVAFSPKGNRIVSGSDDMTLRIWDVETGEVVSAPFEGHTAAVKSVEFSPDGDRVASGSVDGTTRIWDVNSGDTIAGPYQGHINYRGLASPITSVSFSFGGDRVVSGSAAGTVRIWTIIINNIDELPRESHAGSVTSVAYSSDGKRLVSGSEDRTVRVWNVDTCLPVARPFRGHTSKVNSVAFSLDDKRVVSGSDDLTVRVWDANTGKTVAGPFKGHNGPVTSVRFLPSTDHIVSGSEDGTVRIWDSNTGEAVAGPFEGHTGPVTEVGFSPDGKRVVSGSLDRTVRIWDLKSGETIVGPFKGHTGPVTSVSFSPDGKCIASGSGDETIRIWDAQTGKSLARPFEGHTAPVTSVSFSPGGNRLVSGGEDAQLRIWEVSTGKDVFGEMQGHARMVKSVAFSPDGTRVASGSGDTTVRVWNAPADKDADDAPGKIVRLTPKFLKLIISLIPLFPSLIPNNWSLRHPFQPFTQAVLNGLKQGIIIFRGGWICAKTNNDTILLLLWVPEQCRPHIWTSGTVSVMGMDVVLLNIYTFVFASSWTDCFEG